MVTLVVFVTVEKVVTLLVTALKFVVTVGPGIKTVDTTLVVVTALGVVLVIAVDTIVCVVVIDLAAGVDVTVS